jgi:hypothetical protein
VAARVRMQATESTLFSLDEFAEEMMEQQARHNTDTPLAMADSNLATIARLKVFTWKRTSEATKHELVACILNVDNHCAIRNRQHSRLASLILLIDRKHVEDVQLELGSFSNRFVAACMEKRIQSPKLH